jgi:predicted nucleotidyltransferase
VEAQIERLGAGVREVLKEDIVGADLHGSAVLGGLKPRSDVDVIVVSKRGTGRRSRWLVAARTRPGC